RKIIHVDMDAFFASVEELDNPELKGKAVVVGGDVSQRGVVAAASYEARRFGVRSAMPMSRAVRLCPGLVIVRPRGGRYAEVSGMIHEVFERYTPLIEPISLDEAFLDVTGSIGIWDSAEQIGHEIKDAIKDEPGLVASVGIAPNKFLAKLASDLDKPDGFCVITEENKQAILDPLDVGRIWGVGSVTAKKLKEHGIVRVRQLRGMHIEHLRGIVGNLAEQLLELSQGIDGRKVELPGQAKSISQEETFAEDIGDKEVLLAVLGGQVELVAMRLRGAGLAAKTLTLKLRYGDFQTITRSRTLDEATDVTKILWDEAKGVFEKWACRGFRPLRLLGFGVSGFVEAGSQQKGLFDGADDKQKQLDKTVDEIKKRYGKGMIGRKYS
ncbi:MAG: DNA polymerase IV, partial [Anaerohalosphaera sp.]|nr:DNA polymerase IV [Anaerohalosphaera sp.]